MSYNIREEMEKIDHHKTKSYFEEVISSYENKNFRSAIVMLYSVVICDLIYKLSDLRDIHNDQKAEKVLNDLNTDKDENPVSPQWENDLIEKAFREVKILENDVYSHILALKNDRNLSAHPVVSSIEILYKPTEELVKSHIRNMLDGLLKKKPIFSKQVFVPFLMEIARVKNEFSSDEKLKTYLNSKYINYFNDELTEYVFKNLWKFVFKKKGENEDKNRKVNYDVLIILLEQNRDLLEDLVKKETELFSDFTDETIIVSKLINLLALFPNIFKELKTHSQQIIRNRVKENNKYKYLTHFLLPSVKEHFEKLDSESYEYEYINSVTPYAQYILFKQDEIEFLKNLAIKHDCLEEFYDLMISQHIHSQFFNNADYTFNYCVTPYYKNFNKEQFEKLLKGINGNPQCYKRNDFKSDYKIIKDEVCKHLEEGFEVNYQNIF
ncbi:hypothetical protein QRD86_03400 [Bacillus halotolerans]|uniref:hypothetical protein n=1 Tax=Bacillus halotolerans TaxID=260554 RepID=UPI0025700BD6|nr:hypothetical protein [Bacillus halotolerans]WJE43672.1 hypothetical protein QRD86_03400 [Bacillus halotolerans]